MNEQTDLDRLLAAWFTVDAPRREPEPLLGLVLARTVRTRRRPAWRIPERWIPMSTISTRFATTSRFPWRTVGAIALLVLALVGAMVFAGARAKPLPAPFGPAHNGLIAFGDGGDVVAIDPTTGLRTVLIGGSTDDSLPLFSPDGTRLAFVRDSAGFAQLWAADAGGTHQVRLAGVDQFSWVEWSPQSDVIAVTTEARPSVIALARADGSGSTDIDTGLTAAEAPVWRPSDGRQLAFRGKDATGTWGIYLMNRSGTTPLHLDLDPGFKADPYYGENFDYYFQSPAWSPDGSKLMYHTLEPDPSSPAGPGFRIHIADIDRAGAVTNDRSLEFDIGADDEFQAAWLPTGDGIVYGHLEGTESRLMLADATGVTPARDLGLVSQEWMGFHLSPDGHQVVSSVTARPGAEPTIQVTDLASGTTTPVAIIGDYAWQRTAE